MALTESVRKGKLPEMTFVLNEAVVIIRSQGLPQLKNDLKSTDLRIKSLAETIDKTFGRLTKVRSAPFERLTKGVQRYGRATRTYNEDVKNFAESTQKLTDALEKALPTMQRGARSLNSIADSSKVAGRHIKSFGGSFGKLAQQTQGTNRAIRTTGQQTAALTHRFLQISGATKTLEGQFASLGAAFIGGFGIPAAVDLTAKTIGVITNTIGDAVTSAASLESRLAEVATISSDVERNMSGFARVLGDLSVATRTDVGLLSEGLYQTISSGITDTSEALKLLEVAANGARAGLTNVDVVVDGMTSVINAFGFSASDAEGIMDKMFTTVRVGKLRMEDLASSIGKIAPLAVTTGVSFEELLAAGAALTTGGNSLSQSFTAVSGILNAVLRPSEKAKKAAEELGIEWNLSALRAKGLKKFLDDLIIATDGNSDVLTQLIGRVEGLRGGFALTGEQSAALKSNLDELSNSAGATDRAVALINKTFQGQVDLLNQQVSSALRTVGEELLPDATSAVGDLNDALLDVDWEQFREDVRATIEVLKGLFGILEGIVNTARLITTLGRGGISPHHTVRQGLQAGPLARVAVATGQLPTLVDETPAPGSATGTPNRQALQDIAVEFAKTGEITNDHLQTLIKVSKDPKTLTDALKNAGITKDGLAEAIAQQVKKSTQTPPETEKTPSPQLKRAIALPDADFNRYAQATAIPHVIQPGAITSTEPGKMKFNTYLKSQQRAVQPATDRLESQQAVSGVQLRPVTNRLEANRFQAPTVTPVAMTRTPIPGVQGQLVAPGGAIPEPDAAGVYQKALEGATVRGLPRSIQLQPSLGVQGELIQPQVALTLKEAADTFKTAFQLQPGVTAASRVADPLSPAPSGPGEEARSNELNLIATNTQRVDDLLEKDLGPGQAFNEAMAQSQRDAERRPSVPIPPAFGQEGSSYVGFPEFKAQQEQEQRAEQREGVSDVLKGSAEQLASNFSLVSSAIQGGAAGGLPGALIAVGTELLQMTPSFSRISEGFNTVVEKLVMAIEPVVGAIANVLAPVFDALGAVAEALAPAFEVLGKILTIYLTPAFKVLGFVLKGLAKVIETIGNAFVRIINFVIGLVNKLPFVNIPKIQEARARIEPQGTLAQDAEREERERRQSGEPTRGIQVSRITGPTRDIFVDLLRPLRQLDTTFPSMLDALKDIGETLRGNMKAVGGTPLPQMPNLAPAAVGGARGGDPTAFVGIGTPGAQGGIVIDQLHIHVEQVADINADQLQEQLLDNLDVRDRNGGAVFPVNRGEIE